MEVRKSTPFIARQNLGDLLDNSFKMMGRIWRTSLPLALALFIPLSVLLGWIFSRFLAGMAGIVEAGTEATPALAATMAFGYLHWVLILSGASLLFWLASLFVHTAVSVHTAAVAGGRELEFWEIVHHAGRRFFAPCLLQQLAKAALLAGLLVVALLLAVPAIAVAAATGSQVLAAAAGGSGVLLAGAAAALWLSVSLRLARQAVVFDGETVFGSWQHSAHLVRGSWWRLFGISLLVGIMLSFTVGLLTAPVTGAALLPMVSRLVGLALGESSGAADTAEVFRSSAVGLSVGVAAGTFIQAAIHAFFLPVFYGLFYIDLKVHKGELTPRRAAGGIRTVRSAQPARSARSSYTPRTPRGQAGGGGT
jgi:hypothetical protein